MKNLVIVCSAVVWGLGLVSCSGATGETASPSSPGKAHSIGDGEEPGTAAGSPSPSTGSGGASSADTSGGVVLGPSPGDVGVAPVSSGPTTETGRAEPGVLTAGAWDDNRNFDRFLAYRATLTDTHPPGLLPTMDDEHQAAHDEATQTAGVKESLDVSLVIDTTGSMGDEIAYLQAEFIKISSTIQTNHPNADQRWSLVLYRDIADDYVVRWFDFRSDPEDFRTHLAAAMAGGGGDFPESPERGLATMNQLAWRIGPNTARLAFWVADAPHHDQNASAMVSALRGAQDLGIHVYPVASSGVDDLTELSMRSVAQLTLGRYLFLTNDSGVGGDHKEPSIPCYFVTHLDDAILRMVDIELSGSYQEPSVDEIIRTGGDPKNGACTLESGKTVTVF